MTLRIKAYIARQLWRSEGFYEVYNTGDAGLKKALETINK
jgi:carboxyl-terminal processing protease